MDSSVPAMSESMNEMIYEINHIVNCGCEIAQLVRASHRYRKVTSSNPVEVLNFSGFSTQLLNLRS